MVLPIGDRLGRYEILGPLGAGGMGEVYRAKDTELERDVAVKVLPEKVSEDPTRLRRFEREVKSLASLSHPNILEIHDFGRDGEIAYAVTELLEGETLRERLGRVTLGWRAAATMGACIADGLAAAHERGVVHRDLKPENLFLTPDGRMKILDFGLARVAESTGPEVKTEGLEETVTTQGAVLGTAGYMSPEQVQGEPADHHSDIFSLGCVLYEMVAGQRAFDGESGADTMAAILTEEPPDLPSVTAVAPPALEHIVRRCLAKSPEARFQSAADLAFALRTVLTVSGIRRTDLGAPAPRRRRRSLFIGVAGMLFGGALATAGVFLLRDEPPTPRPPHYFSIPLPEGEEAGPRGLALSPDGTRLVRAGTQLYQRRLDRLEELQPIPDTELAMNPFFSPDGRWLGFTSAEGKLTKMPIDGGMPVVLADAYWRSRPIWGVDDFIVFNNPEKGVSKISAHGGEPITLTTIEPGTTAAHQSPQLLPGGRVLLYVRYDGDPQVLARHLDTGEVTELTRGRTARYLSSGHLVYITREAVFARPFNPDRLEFTGPPFPVLEGVWPRDQIAVSENGSMAYVPQPTGRLVWIDRDGTVSPATAELHWHGGPRLSPDQRHIAFEVVDEVWLYDRQRGAFSSIDAPGWNTSPVWTPDGQWLTFTSDRAGWFSVESHAVDGSGREELLIGGFPDEGGAPESWSSDGRHLLFTRGARDFLGRDIWVLPADGEDDPYVFIGTDAEEVGPVFSPDGRWVAYGSNRSGRQEIYVTDFPDRMRTIRISTDGGRQALWDPDGRTIYYRDGERVMAVPVTTGPPFEAGRPEALFKDTFSNRDRNGRDYDITADGERFLMVQPDPAHIVVVTDWFSELERLAPTE
jgi:Tol biopolymer transport system component